MRAVPATRPNPSRVQRVALYALAVALVAAPVLVNLWPAFGKGPMLYVGEPAAAPLARAGHERHVDRVVLAGRAAHAEKTDAALPGDQSSHEEHGHAGHAGRADNAGVAGVAQGAHHADHATDVDDGADRDRDTHSAASHSQHAQHCALCVLASLGWAPFVALATQDKQFAAAERAAPPARRVFHVALTWRSAHPRAPPFFS